MAAPAAATEYPQLFLGQGRFAETRVGLSEQIVRSFPCRIQPDGELHSEFGIDRVSVIQVSST